MNRNERFTDVECIKSIAMSNNSELVNSFLRVFDLGYNDSKNKGVIDRTELISFSAALQALNVSGVVGQGIFLGTKVPKIYKQTDMLRFTKTQVFNLEVKESMPKGGVTQLLRQLQNNALYLRPLGLDMLLATYVVNVDTFYLLKEAHIEQISSEELLAMIDNDDYVGHNSLMDVDGSEYLLSPINDIEKFKNSHYYLNDHQNQVVMRIIGNSQNFLITGGPGTGKTLVVYDLANKLLKLSQNVVIVFSGMLSDAHIRFTQETGIKIISARDFLDENYDVIIIDEAQRLREETFNTIMNTNSRKIFVGDSNQVFHPGERSRDIFGTLRNMEYKVENLKDKMRSNPEMSVAIQKILNVKEGKHQPIQFDGVSVQYFADKNAAKEFIEHRIEQNNEARLVEFTEYQSRMTGITIEKSKFDESVNVHEVIGQEFDEILVILDKSAYYDIDGKLKFRTARGYPYLKRESIYEAMTRVRENLRFVVIDNPDVFIMIQSILSWQDDKILESVTN